MAFKRIVHIVPVGNLGNTVSNFWHVAPNVSQSKSCIH